MKKIYLLLGFAFLAGNVCAQDTILKRDASEFKAKVVRVSATEIEYRKWENLEGPIYTVPTADVFLIK